MFSRLLTSIVSTSNHTKYMSWSNQNYMINYINLHFNKYSPDLRYYYFVVNFDRCAESCNALDGLSSKVCVPDEAEVLNLHVFNMITEINESKILTKHISLKCECKFDS